MANDDIESIKNRIRKLLSRAQSGADGADLAMSMATGLMLKHSIEQKEVGGDVVKAKKGKMLTKIGQEKINLLSAAAILYGCRVLLYDRGKSGHAFIGRDDNIEAAEMTALWLSDQVDYLFKTAYKEAGTHSSSKSHGEFRKNFKMAASNRVYWRAHDLINNPPEHLLKDIGQNSLVVKDHFALLQKENEEILSRMDTKVLKPSKQKIGFGFNEGHTAGATVKLRSELK